MLNCNFYLYNKWFNGNELGSDLFSQISVQRTGSLYACARYSDVVETNPFPLTLLHFRHICGVARYIRWGPTLSQYVFSGCLLPCVSELCYLESTLHLHPPARFRSPPKSILMHMRSLGTWPKNCSIEWVSRPN